MTYHSVSTQVENGYWINFIPNINISINDIIDKITPFLGIWEVSGSDPFPDTPSDTRVFIRQLTEDNDAQESVIKAWNPVYKRNNQESNYPDMLRMFHSYWIFSIRKLEHIEANFRPYYNQLFRSLNFRQHLRDRDSPESDSVSLVLFDNFASTILDVSGSKIDYDTFDRLFNFNQDVSNHSITSGDLSIDNIFALFIQDDISNIDIANFYESNILQSRRLTIQSINLSKLEVLHFGKDSRCTTISRNSFNSSLGNLQQLILPKEIETIDDFAFRNSGRLNFVLIPRNITTLGEGCFQDCSSLRIINFDYDVSNLKIIPKNFCKENISLNSCILPGSVTDICDSAFEGCLNLTHFEFSSINSIRHIGEAAFRGSGIKRISRTDDQVFFVGTQSSSTNNDAELREIGIQAFANCNHLQIANLATFTNLTGVSERLFLDSSSLISVYLPPRVEIIHESAFQGCSSLRYLFYSITNNFFKDIRMQRNFFSASTRNINLSQSNDDPRRNPLHFFRAGDRAAVNLLYSEVIILRRNFEIQNLSSYSSFLSIIEANAFNGTIFNTILIPSTCRTLSRNCFENSNISCIIFLGSLPQPLSSIFLYDFDSIDTTQYRSPFLRDDSYISYLFQTIFPDLDNSDNYFNFPIKDIIYFSNATNIRERHTLKLPWNIDNSFNTRNYFNVRKNDKIIARINFHEIDLSTQLDNSNTSLFGNIAINETIINRLSSIHHLTIENLIQSIENDEIAHLYREQRFQSYYFNLSINNFILMSLINNLENDNLINLSESSEIDSIVKLIVKFDTPEYFNIHNKDPGLNQHDLSFSIRPDILKESLVPGVTNISYWPPYLSPLACDYSYGPVVEENNNYQINVIKIPRSKIGFLWTAYLGYAGLLEASRWNTRVIDLSNIYNGNADSTINNDLFSNIYDNLGNNQYKAAIQAGNQNGVGRRLSWREFRNFYLHEQQNYLQLRNRFIRIVNNNNDIRSTVNDTIIQNISDESQPTTNDELSSNFFYFSTDLEEYSDYNNQIEINSSKYIVQNRFTIHNDYIYVLIHDSDEYKILRSSLDTALNNILNWDILDSSTNPINILVVGSGASNDAIIAYSFPFDDNTTQWGGAIHLKYNDNTKLMTGRFDRSGFITFLKRGNNPDILLDRWNGMFRTLDTEQDGYITFTQIDNGYFTNNKDRGFACRSIPDPEPIRWFNRPYYEADDPNDLSFGNGANTGSIIAPQYDGTSYEGIVQVECDELHLYVLAEDNSGTILSAKMEQIKAITTIPINGTIDLSWTLIAREVNEGETIVGWIASHQINNNRLWFYRPKMVLDNGQIYLERNNRIVRLRNN